MITATQYNEISTRHNALMLWVDSIRGKNGWASYKPEDKPATVPDVTNEERSALEVYDFVNNPPDKYFLYVDEVNRTVTTWTGEKLGSITFLGVPYRCGRYRFAKRQSIRVTGINGVKYSGTYYTSSGNYARIKRLK